VRKVCVERKLPGVPGGWKSKVMLATVSFALTRSGNPSAFRSPIPTNQGSPPTSYSRREKLPGCIGSCRKP